MKRFLNRAEKSRRYDELEKKLAEIYLTTPEIINCVRSGALGHKKSIKEIIAELKSANDSKTETIKLIMKNISKNVGAIKWLEETSAETIKEMLSYDI